MSSTPSPAPVSRLRFIRAYVVTFQILFRYFFLSIRRRFASPERITEITAQVHQKTTRQIIRNILRLKGLYIKIGQTLSIMTNFLPKSMTEGLEELQDDVPPHPYSEVEARFIADFGKTPHEIFARFDEKPIAAASLGQVHIAYASDGTKLAVKLQYPQIDEVVRSDLKTIRRIFGILNFIFPHYGIKQTYRECAAIILQELDYKQEGKNLEEIRSHFRGNEQYVFPKVHWEHSSAKVLTLEFIDGIKVSDVETLEKAGIQPRDVAVGLIHGYCKQIFIDGVYHADPHPGNIIIQPFSTSTESFEAAITPRIALVDYGATARVPAEMKAGIILFVEGLIKRDTIVISRAMKQIGFIAKEENEEIFDKIVDYFYSKIKGIKIENFREINLAEFQHLNDIIELKKMDISFRDLMTTFHVPKDWILLERTLLLMMGLTAHLDPHLNPMDIVLPYVEEFVLGKEKKMADLIVSTTKEVMQSYITLPSELHKVLKKLQEGKVSFSDKHTRKQAEKIYAGFHQLIYALFFTLCVVMNYWLKKDGNLEWSGRMEAGAVFFAVMLGWNFLRNR